jgi:hypothetical protein
MPYIEYPKALRHEKHGHKTVHNKEQEDAARAEGWATHTEIEAQKQADADAPAAVDPAAVDDASAGVIEDAADADEDPGASGTKRSGKHKK